MTTSPNTTSADFPGNATPAQLLYPDMAQELANTRRLLERVPDGNDPWKPHTKSMSLGSLATHVAELPRFATMILTTEEFDFGAGTWPKTEIASNADRLALFDKVAADMTAGINAADWSALEKGWKLRAGDQVYMNDRKANLLRNTISHIAHHRAQLGVYLRQLDIPVPGMYGPSADEM